ncbi:MAG: N-6 DNA methylase [Candidatus Heimdallarchaeota archaeon]|nr:MAG: N-6 DNA methylase [Candidatus Heimdallarchaeota archaeon]
MTNITINRRLKSQNENVSRINEWMNNFKVNFSFNTLPADFHNLDEFLLSYLASSWLIHFFNNKIRIKSSTAIFNKLKDLTERYPQSCDLWEFIDTIFSFLNEKMILDSLLGMKIPELRNSLINDTLGTLLQNCLTQSDRKRLAANYTTHNSAKLLVNTLDIQESYSSIIDPFCGSGRLISAYLMSRNSRGKFPHIRIHDLMPSAVLIAYCRLILILSEYDQDLSFLQASIGDAFAAFSNERYSKEFGKFDLVLINPPFTRTHRINKNQRKNLLAIEEQYSQYLSGQVGLHIYAVLLADLLMKEDGVLGAILPAATISSQYSNGVHEFFLNNFQLKTIASSEDEKAYSEDSNLREIILIAKRDRSKKEEEIQFLRIDSHEKSRSQIFSTQIISKDVLAKEWNWTIFLRDPELLKIRNLLLQSGFIKNGKDLGFDIVRGVEMYGPDFFFIPNRKWKISSEEKNKLILKNNGNTIEVPKEFLVRSLRKPGKYNQFISPKVSDFALSIPTSNISQKWIKDYLEVSEQFASPAKRKFRQDWISHIHNQIETKKPSGHIFFIDKFGISSTSIMSHFFEKKINCSKNFYVLRNCTATQAKLHAAWLNSTLFIILYLLSRREIGGSYGRLQIIDYLKEPLFLDFSKYTAEIKAQINQQFDRIRRFKLPPIPEQLQLPQRRALDSTIIQGLKLPRITEDYIQTSIYPLLKRIFTNLERRDNT